MNHKIKKNKLIIKYLGFFPLNLRPSTLEEIIGQSPIKQQLHILIDAAKRGENLDHILFTGESGLGKTTFALVLSSELGVDIQITNGANLRSIKNLLPYLMNITEKSILFIDELHRITNVVEDYLLPVVEDFRASLVSPREAISVPIPQFTLVGATTHMGTLNAPLLGRFSHKCRLQPYFPADLTELLKYYSKKINVLLSNEVAQSISERSRGIPRVAVNLLKWIKNYVVAKQISSITPSTIDDACRVKGIDKRGLNEDDRMYLSSLRLNKPTGLKTLCSITGLEKETIEETIEPFLLRQSLIIKTSKGRILA